MRCFTAHSYTNTNFIAQKVFNQKEAQKDAQLVNSGVPLGPKAKNSSEECFKNSEKT